MFQYENSKYSHVILSSVECRKTFSIVHSKIRVFLLKFDYGFLELSCTFSEMYYTDKIKITYIVIHLSAHLSQTGKYLVRAEDFQRPRKLPCVQRPMSHAEFEK